MCATSPPYWGLRDYGTEEQLGLEDTPREYVERLVAIFRELRRVLKDQGTLWLNLGDTFNEKQLLGVPWRVAFSLQDDGWLLRSDIIWHKPNPMPESVSDRPTKSHEYIFLMAKNQTYYYDADALREPHESVRWGGRFHKDNPSEKYREPNAKIASAARIREDRPEWDHYPEGGKNARTVWRVPVRPYEGAHFATFPEDLVEKMISAGCPPGGVVLDPFVGSGTTCAVARKSHRASIGIELNEDYLRLASRRLQQLPLF
jgi:DNA modification methylase